MHFSRCKSLLILATKPIIIEGIVLLKGEFILQVLLCANSRPALNDVTYNEMSVLTKRVAAISDDINSALTQGRLLIMESGQGSPCLDLRYVLDQGVILSRSQVCVRSGVILSRSQVCVRSGCLHV